MKPGRCLGALSADPVRGSLHRWRPTRVQIKALEQQSATLQRNVILSFEWQSDEAGSWFRRFFTSLGHRFGEHDLDTLKRAGEVHLLDRFEAEAASNDAGGIGVANRASVEPLSTARGQAPSGSASANLGRHGASGVCRRRSRRSSLSLSSAKKSGESLDPRLWTAAAS